MESGCGRGDGRHLAGSTPAEERRRGRGATANPTGRFEAASHEAFADGWDREEELPPLRTEVTMERARSIITRNDSPDIGFDRSINPYRGCEHGCVYCFARPNHAYAGLSPGLDFETKLFAKVLTSVSPEGKRLLVVDSAWTEPVLRASRNIGRAVFSNSSNLNALDLVRTPRVLISEAGLKNVLERTKN